MGNEYDRILRENISEIFIPLVERQLGVEIVESKTLPTKFTGTFEREVDHLFDVRTKAGLHFLIHFEFQTKRDHAMLRRMALYHGNIYFEYGLPIRHFVIYLGQSPARMRSQLEEEAIFKGYQLVSIRRQPLSELLASEVPQEVVLGILSDFGSLEEEEVIRKIIQRLQETSADAASLKISLKQLGILSRISKLDGKVIKEINKMPLDIDFRGHVLFKEGMAEGEARGLAKGEAKGLAKGEAKGLAKGIFEGKRKIIIQLYREGLIGLGKAAKVLGTSERQILAYAEAESKDGDQ